MFHFSTDRLAGLDNMILKITAPPKVPTLIPNHDAYVPVKKLRKQKPRPPLADMIASNNLVCNSTTPVRPPVHITSEAPRPPRPTSRMLSHTPYTPREVKLLSPEDTSSRVPSSTDTPSFRPLPPLPSASTLQLPSFLNFSSQSLDSLADPPPSRSTTSLPAPTLFRVSSSPIPSSHRVVIRKTKNSKVFVGPQWIPAFHHPNSPYVPWSSPVRRRILPPPSPLPSSPSSLPSRIRPGAVAPEPWASSTFSQAHDRSKRERFSSSWKSFKHSIKERVKTVISRIGKSTKSLGMLCTSRDMLHTYDGTDTAIIQPHLFSDSMQTTFAKTCNGGPRDSLMSFSSSDSRALAAWLAERRTTASCVADDIPLEMSVEEYELMGSWLDLRHCDGGWLCGIQDCGMHTSGGSPCTASEYPNGLRTAMPFDDADWSVTRASPRPPASPFPAGPFSAPPRFYSLPRLPCQLFDIYSAQEAEPTTTKQAGRCRELSMPGGWTFS